MSSPAVEKPLQKGDTAARSGETVERIAAELRTRILDGRFVPGQRLISREIVEQLGIARGTLREAFRRLEADRLLDVVPNRGAVVRQLSPAEIIHVYQIREALEGFASRQAAARIDEVDNRERFVAVLQKGRRHHAEPVFQDFIVDNRAFHQEIVRISGNPPLGELIDKYQLPVFMIQLRQSIGIAHVIRNALEEHEEIAAGILSGDSDSAYLGMKRHLMHSAELLRALPSMNPVSLKALAH